MMEQYEMEQAVIRLLRGCSESDIHKSNILVWKDCSDSFERYINRGIRLSGYDCVEVDCNRISRYSLFQRQWVLIKYILSHKRLLGEYDRIIVFDRHKDILVLSLLLRNSKKLKLELWLWNLLDNRTEMRRTHILNKKRNIRVWTFDAGDAIRFNILHNSQFHVFRRDYQIKYQEDDGSVFFVGRNKGRNEMIDEIKHWLDKFRIPYDIKIIEDSNGRETKNQLVEYEKTLDRVKKCHCVLDIVQDNQIGLTMRTMEAVYFNKRIISNNKLLINELFYDEKNIFIIGVNDFSDFESWYNAGNITYSDKAKGYYSFSRWIKRFDVPI